MERTTGYPNEDDQECYPKAGETDQQVVPPRKLPFNPVV
jgi:hypothetical protein